MESKQQRRDQWLPRRCVAFTVAAIIGVALLVLVLVLVLGLTVFRPRHAVTDINSVHLGGLTVGLDVPNLAVDLNVTLTLDITSTNPNHASFCYDVGDAVLYYRGHVVGEAAVPPGKVAAEGSVRTNVSLSVMAGKLMGNSALYADVISGSVPFSTTTRIPGTVAILGIFKHHMVAYTMCDLVVGVRNQSVENYNCRYRTKF